MHLENSCSSNREGDERGSDGAPNIFCPGPCSYLDLDRNVVDSLPPTTPRGLTCDDAASIVKIRHNIKRYTRNIRKHRILTIVIIKINSLYIWLILVF